MLLGGYIIKFFGSILLFCCAIVIALIKNKTLPSFKEVWLGTYKGDLYGVVATILFKNF